jgi:hypothetical protein
MQVVSCIPHLSESSPDGRLYISVLRSSRPGRRGCSTQAQTAGGFGGFLFAQGVKSCLLLQYYCVQENRTNPGKHSRGGNAVGLGSPFPT